MQSVISRVSAVDIYRFIVSHSNWRMNNCIERVHDHNYHKGGFHFQIITWKLCTWDSDE